MFNKLVSNLPFNPSLINQVAFYSKRLKQEASIRRLGFILVCLTIFLQLFAILSPAQPTFARAGNDLIPGGFTSKDQLVQYCNTNYQDIATIYGHFGITCANLQNNSVETSLVSTAEGGQLYSMGRQPQGPVNVSTGKATNEFQVSVSGLNYPLYMRLLSSWDHGASSTYRALSVGNAFGVHFYILFSCGNLVQIGKPATPTPTPTPKPTPQPKPCVKSKDVNDVTSCLVPHKQASNLTAKISNANGTTAHAGDVIQYTLTINNPTKVTAKKFLVIENLSDVLEYADLVSLGGAAKDSAGNLRWPLTDIAAGQTIKKVFTVKVKNPIPDTPSPCPATSAVNKCPQSNSFDLVMTNVYGDTVNIKLPKGVIKTTEIVTTTSIPNTGPGASLIVGFIAVAVVGYFYARSRLLAKELDLIRQDYVSGGN